MPERRRPQGKKPRTTSDAPSERHSAAKKPGAAKKHGAKQKPSALPKPSASERRSGTEVRVRKAADDDAWELVHPRCARDRAEDLDEVRNMIEADELEVARDELRWLLGGCSDCLEAHQSLGELALLEHDLPLARGHFGYAYRLATQALARAKIRGPLPYRRPANQSFFAAGKGLAYCLRELGKADMAAEVIAQLLECDPSDPLGLRGMLPPSPGE